MWEWATLKLVSCRVHNVASSSHRHVVHETSSCFRHAWHNMSVYGGGSWGSDCVNTSIRGTNETKMIATFWEHHSPMLTCVNEWVAPWAWSLCCRSSSSCAFRQPVPTTGIRAQCIFYEGSAITPQEPPQNKLIIPRMRPATVKMGDNESLSTMACSVQESSLMWLMLTFSNYLEWAMSMQCNYEAIETWEVVDLDAIDVKCAHDWHAIDALLRSMSGVTWVMLESKKTVKEVWEVVKSMHVGVDPIKESHAQQL